MLDTVESQKQSVGRPTKYRPEFVEQAVQLCRDEGYTDEQLAATFKISTKQLYVWKNKYSEFREAINSSKEAFDTRVVENSLLKRAMGYEYKETITVRGEVVKAVKKLMAPDVPVCIFWLKNRNPKRRRDAQQQVVSAEPTEEITIEDIKEDIRKLEEAGTGLVVEQLSIVFSDAHFATALRA